MNSFLLALVVLLPGPVVDGVQVPRAEVRQILTIPMPKDECLVAIHEHRRVIVDSYGKGELNEHLACIPLDWEAICKGRR
jgi:hypothetical protein